MSKELTITVTLDEETIKELFEEYEVKFSAKKLKTLKECLDNNLPDAQEVCEEAFKEYLGDIISDEFGE